MVGVKSLHFSLSLTYNQTTRDRTLQNSRAADRRIKKAGEGRVGLNMYGCGYTTSKVTVMMVICNNYGGGNQSREREKIVDMAVTVFLHTYFKEKKTGSMGCITVWVFGGSCGSLGNGWWWCVVCGLGWWWWCGPSATFSAFFATLESF